MTGTRLYREWRRMLNRCVTTNEKNKKYYLDKGITVCEEWKSNFESFHKWAMDNGYNDNLTLDRINNNLGFSAEDRIENIRRIAEIGKLFVQTGVVTLACFVSPTNDIRQMAREIVGKEDFLEVYISTPIEECERRDVKGLYARARKGEVKNFTGISAPFEAPVSPDIAIDTSKIPLEESVRTLTELIIKRVKQQ